MASDLLYNAIGTGYNSTRKADPYLAKRLFEFLLPQPGHSYLDLGCGTGNYTIALAHKGIKFTGLEPSEKMLAIARAQNQQVNWLLGSAEKIPLGNEVFDGAMATLTIHHWMDLQKAFAEIYRVLKQGARLVIFTASPQQMQGYWLNHYFPQMLARSITQMPALDSVQRIATGAGFTIVGFEKYFIHDDLQDHFLYAGKNKPQLYLDSQVRHGISSFSALSVAAEVKQGLLQLEQDIASDRFGAIREKYNNELGDYLFIIAEK